MKDDESLFFDHLIYISKANNKLISFWQNPSFYEIGYHTDKSIVKYKITKETRNLWRFYLNKNDFEMAKKYCQVLFIFQFYNHFHIHFV